MPDAETDNGLETDTDGESCEKNAVRIGELSSQDSAMTRSKHNGTLTSGATCPIEGYISTS